MLKKTIAYVDYNGVERKEDFYFHLSIPELTRLEAQYGGDISKHAVNLVNDGELTEMVSFLEDLILSSVGVKTKDGRSFVKNKEIREKFEYSQAYAEMFQEIFTDPEAATAFGKGLSQTKEPKKDRLEVLKEEVRQKEQARQTEEEIEMHPGQTMFQLD